MEFPRLVYKAADEHTLAEDQDQYDALIKDGWFGSVPEAKEKKHAVKPVVEEPVVEEPVVEEPVVEEPVVEEPVVEEPVVEEPPTRTEMEAQAKKLGIKFNKNTTDADLLQLITDKLDA